LFRRIRGKTQQKIQETLGIDWCLVALSPPALELTHEKKIKQLQMRSKCIEESLRLLGSACGAFIAKDCFGK
jgi:hypothetical protein